MRERHGFHRTQIQDNFGGLRSHFSKHAEEMGIVIDTNTEYIMQ